MSQHFLLSAKARTLSVRKVFAMTDDQAFSLFRELRWGVGEETGCPICASVAKHYFIRSRRQWRCRDCNHTFSVTSGTIFAFCVIARTCTPKCRASAHLGASLAHPWPEGCASDRF